MQTTIPTLGTISWGRRLMPAAAAFGLLLVLGFAQPALAQTSTNPLVLTNNYFVTGDYVVSGWQKDPTIPTTTINGVPYATGNIQIPDSVQAQATGVPSPKVPDGADIVAAFLYWETVESTAVLPPNPGKNGFFNGYAITGSFLPSPTPNAPTSWSSGGCSGGAQGVKTIQGYRADVRPFLPVDANGKVQGNGPFQVRLADSGTNGSTVPFTLGATLVIIYRVQSPLVALNSIVIYDGTFAPSNALPGMSQQIVGFYQAAASPVAKITHIVGNGQPNKLQTVSLINQAGNSVNLPSLYPLFSATPFPGIYNGSWDNPTWPVNAAVLANDASETTSVIPVGKNNKNNSNGGCVNWGAVIFSSTVQDTDGDGLLDVWEDGQGYTDAISGQFVALPGANKLVKDIFVEIDYLSNLDGLAGPYKHSHLPKQLALDLVGDASAAQNVRVHFDVGPTNYLGNCSTTNPAACPDPYIIQAGTGGNPIPESAVLCSDTTRLCQFPGTPAVGWKEGFLFVRDNAMVPNSNPPVPLGNFQSGRKYSYHYVLFGHALGAPRTFWSAFGTTEQSTAFPKLVSILNSGTAAVVTIQTPQGPVKPGDCPNAAIPACSDANVDRVTVTGAIGQPALNGTYHFTNLSSSTVGHVTTTTFTIATTNATANCPSPPCVADGTYNFSNESRLSVEYGGPTSTSGHSDVGGGDSAVTFGLWLADDALGCQADPSVTLAPGQAYCVNQVGTTTAEGGTLLHELGHTNFLTHGGTFFPNEAGVVTSGVSAGQYLNSPPVVPSYGLNCNPGFLSSMNYLFQIRGFPDNAGIDYSRQMLQPTLLQPLDETQLSESIGIGSDVFTGLPAAHFTRWYAPPNALDTQLQNATGGRFATHHCNGTPIGPNEPPAVRVDGSTFSTLIDWNNDLIIPDAVSPQDVNFNGIVGDAPFPGFNDWINLDLRQVDSRANTLGLSSGGGFPDLSGGGTEQDLDTACSTADRPTGLSAVQTGQKTVVLNWMAPGDCQVKQYDIWRAVGTFSTLKSVLANHALFNHIATVNTPTPPATTFTDTNVKNNTTYTYFVTDTNKKQGAQSGASASATITIVP